MARIIGCVTTSHVPAIGNAIAKGRQEEPYWKEWFDGFTPVHRWLDRVRPDVAVVVYNDHGLNFFLDKLPTFAIGAATEYQTADEGERAGFIDKEFDRKFMASMVTDPSWATRYSTVELVEQAGSQGIELILWLTARAVLGAGSGGRDVGVREVAATCHVPISNTAAGRMLLEPAG